MPFNLNNSDSDDDDDDDDDEVYDEEVQPPNVPVAAASSPPREEQHAVLPASNPSESQPPIPPSEPGSLAQAATSGAVAAVFCPAGHRLQEPSVNYDEDLKCDRCQRSLASAQCFSCLTCDFDLCMTCCGGAAANGGGGGGGGINQSSGASGSSGSGSAPAPADDAGIVVAGGGASPSQAPSGSQPEPVVAGTPAGASGTPLAPTAPSEGGSAADASSRSRSESPVSSMPKWKPCGVNGCVLHHKHTGLCAIEFLENSARQRGKAPALPFPMPEPPRARRPASERPPPKPKVLPGAPESWHGASTGHVEEDVWEVEAPLRDRRIKGRRREYLVHWSGWSSDNGITAHANPQTAREGVAACAPAPPSVPPLAFSVPLFAPHTAAPRSALRTLPAPSRPILCALLRKR